MKTIASTVHLPSFTLFADQATSVHHLILFPISLQIMPRYGAHSLAATAGNYEDMSSVLLGRRYSDSEEAGLDPVARTFSPTLGGR